MCVFVCVLKEQKERVSAPSVLTSLSSCTATVTVRLQNHVSECVCASGPADCPGADACAARGRHSLSQEL